MRWLSVGLLLLGVGCGGGSANLRIGTMPEGGTFEGVWQSPQYGNMHLCQSGSQIIGDYEKDERHGRLQGTIQGDVLRFQWDEAREMVVGRPRTTRGRGYFRISVGEDGGHYILGEWGVDSDETGGGPWNAAKMRRQTPTRCAATDAVVGGGGNSYDDDDDYGDDDSYDDDSSGGYEEDPGTSDLEGLDEY